ncbi:MAG: hypothetical protein FJX52_14730, partial [Alphaproteobacteria bacterium]|nr:hypothetical protein [Alphaproteobacteria bacterium]
MSAIADAMYEVSDAPPEQGSVPSAIAKAARFLVDLKSGKVAQRGDVAEAKAPGAGPTRTDSVGAASG